MGEQGVNTQPTGKLKLCSYQVAEATFQVVKCPFTLLLSSDGYETHGERHELQVL